MNLPAEPSIVRLRWGAAERLASYPASLWMLIISAVVVVTPSTALTSRISRETSKVTAGAPR